ncbi:hypothetical protein TRFO_02016 [Tritrichomonas foetus]|uniref:Amino acid transporter transmembrane domain-containing protein n=1 Tax=Tritrichomonas foetus TaxID=1144522 RepID=A0A1J4JH39_9EUKA|nr:hypothetical protein TRFO_02016 [Tritrichomonas foetus]|eukprot:OHS96907.1 hypothetical protein TRFO_02016 [Tritrichomonas foetus]
MKIISSKADPGDQLITPERRLSSSFFSITIIIIGGFTCTGCLKASNSYKCGIIIGTLVNIVIGLITLFALRLGVTTMKHTKLFYADQIWASFSPRTRIISTFIVFITSFSFVIWYYRYVVSLVQRFLSLTIHDTPKILNNTFAICAIVMVIVTTRYYANQSLRYIIIMTYIKYFVLIFMFIINIYMIFKLGISHSITLVSVTPQNLLDCVTTHVSIYCGMMLFYAYIWQMRTFTSNRGNKCCNISIFMIFLIHQIFGITGYLLFGNDQNGVMIDNFPPEELVTKIDYACFIVLVAISIPVLFQPCHRALLHYFYPVDPFPNEVWAISGISLMVLGISLLVLQGTLSKLMYFIMDFFSGILCFILPAILYLGAVKKKKTIFNIVGCIFLIMLGIAYCSLMVFNYFVLS